jgi:type IV pilus assembly protein PilY1
LGDIVHSTPSIVTSPRFRYRDTIPGTTTDFELSPYSGFKTKFASSECFTVANDGTISPIVSWAAGSGSTPGSREPMVYFGANDGALHAISACTGFEKFAFVPEAVYPKLSELTDLEYAHRYYVDGAPTVVDAYINSAWRTVLVGTLGAGGKGLFALDVTDPNSFSETNASSMVLWEKNLTDTGYGALGYTFSQPAIVKAEGHGWVAIFGNGYNGAGGKAVLYVARLSDGVPLATIDLSAVDATAHGSDGANGLAAISIIDRDSDGDADLIYGGDLKGNVWRFEAPTSGSFSTANTTLLYSAKSAASAVQPITARFSIGRHPTSAVGRMVYFGTGKYYELADQDPSNAVQYNTMYGLWDRDDGNRIPTVEGRNSNRLQEQEIELEQLGSFGSNSFEIRTLSNNPIKWQVPGSACDSNSANGVCGWYLDLESTGEKMVASPVLRAGRLIFVTTIPSLVPCSAGGTGWLLEIDPYTGGRLDLPVFDLNGDGVFDFNDNLATSDSGSTIYVPVSGKKSKVGIIQPPAILAGIGGVGDKTSGNREGKYSSGSKAGEIEVTIEQVGLGGVGRKSWLRLQ